MAENTLSSTRCEEGGPELLPPAIAVARDHPVDLSVVVCSANARVRVHVDNDLRVDETGASEVVFRLPPLDPGWHLLFWSVQTNSPTWQTRDEVAVNGVVVFRRRKRDDGTNPVNAGFLYVQVA